jgi:nucleoside-triphosphatase
MAATPKNILITGSPGSGKTTLIREVAERLSAAHPVGFYTREIRVGGVRQGFEAVSFSQKRRILAHTKINSQFRVGKYAVDIDGFDSFLKGIDMLSGSNKLIVIDEIGKMECFSAQFRQLVMAALGSPATVVATVAQRGAGLIEEVKKRPDAIVFELTRHNRNHLASDIIARVDL